MKKIIAIIGIPLLFQFPLYAQDLEKHVSLEFRATPLEVVLQELSQDYRIRFSYGGHPQALDHRISIKVKDMPLGQLLGLILKGAGLSYKVIGGNVVLRALEHKESVNPEEEHLTLEEKAPDARKPESLPQAASIAPAAPVVPEMRELQIGKVMIRKKVIPVVDKQPSALMLSPVFSMEIARMDQQSVYPSNQQLTAGLAYSLGGAGVWELSDKLFLEMQLLYRKKAFTIHYGLETLGDPIGMPVETEVEIAYAEVPLDLNFSLLRHKLLTVYGVGGLFGSYLVKKQELTQLDDGRRFNTTAMHTQTLSEFLWGVRGGVSLSYSRANKVFIFLTPAYQYTAKPMKEGTQQILLREYMLRSGVRFRL